MNGGDTYVGWRNKLGPEVVSLDPRLRKSYPTHFPEKFLTISVVRDFQLQTQAQNKQYTQQLAGSLGQKRGGINLAADDKSVCGILIEGIPATECNKHDAHAHAQGYLRRWLTTTTAIVATTTTLNDFDARATSRKCQCKA
ncbi:unnamed protein product [Ceratitis capitata]|uniref:(Mediterranean fruit fly) hypothetical protein n=1 Tax=Ceratitis capitata TaxID=7213 RepID=A0A811V6C4_CERCA|nr:unnamed protein product [Ceratitis capitata]